MKMQNSLARPLVWAAAFTALAVSLTGCGAGSSNNGGANNGGGGGSNAPVDFTGTVLTSTGVPAVGDTVRYGSSASGTFTATTDAQGQFTISVPPSSLIGSPVLVVLDSSGNVVGIQSISTQTGISITLPSVPPAPTNLNPTG
jgi:hypothetical protein